MSQLTSVETVVISAATSVVVTIIGLLIGHFLTTRRDRANEQRKQRATVLLNAFSTLLSVSNNPDLWKFESQLQRANAEIQALGTVEQIKLAQKFFDEIGKGNADMDPLLKSLRDDLRDAIGAKAVSGSVQWIQIKEKKNSNA
jgi:hypothetical protein